jgi:hypothetical protein
MRNVLLICPFFSVTIFAQITITGTDITNVFAIGNSATINEYASASINIGSPGGGNNWDFSGLQSSSTINLLCVDPVTTPYANEFAGADFATYTHVTDGSEEGYLWFYLSLNGNLGDMGNASTIVSLPALLFITKNNPTAIEAQLPLTFNTSWMQTYTKTNYINDSTINQSTISIDVNVDAYGTMILPGGASFEALRIREAKTVNSATSVTYTFASENDAQVNLEASDPNPPNGGVINVNSYTWNLAFTSSVDQLNGLPSNYILRQNYPNPFNPSTKIEYRIPEASFVQLKVYDILGNEVAELVNEEQVAGNYRTDFKAENLASGLYIAKLQAGNYSKTIKMSLLK